MSKKDETFYYGMADFKNDIHDLRDTDLANLEMAFPSYYLRWRPEIIKGIRDGKSHYQIVEAKLKAMDAASRSQESADGLKGNISYKLQRAAFRIIYLRYRKQDYPRKKAGKLARQDRWPDKVGNKKFTEQFRANTLGCSWDE